MQIASTRKERNGLPRMALRRKTVKFKEGICSVILGVHTGWSDYPMFAQQEVKVRIASSHPAILHIHFPHFFLCSLSERWRGMCWWRLISSTTCRWRTSGSSEAPNSMRAGTPWPSSSTTGEMDTTAWGSWVYATSQVRMNEWAVLSEAKQIWTSINNQRGGHRGSGLYCSEQWAYVDRKCKRGWKHHCNWLISGYLELRIIL